MADPLLTYRLVPRNVQAQVIDDRALILSFETGKYYTVFGTGAEVVKALVEGPIDPAQVVKFVLESVADEITPAYTFFAELLKEHLIEPYMLSDGAPVRVVFTGELSFPPIEIKSELADLLLTDPIHDVTPEGWPEKS